MRIVGNKAAKNALETMEEPLLSPEPFVFSFRKDVSMSRCLAVTLLLCCATSSASAQEFAQFENTYHVEVRIEHWRIGVGSWSSEYSTTDYEDAVFMLEFFELALEQQALREMLGLSWQWLVTDVRLRTEYPEQLFAPIDRARPMDLLRLRPGYEKPTYGYPGD